MPNFEEMGRNAFRAGKMRAPARDPLALQEWKDRQVGDKRNTKEMKAWIRGWDKENLR